MPRLILLLLAAFGIWYVWQYVKTRPPQERKRFLWVWGSALLLIVTVILVGTGRMHWVGALFAALIPLLQTIMRWLPRIVPLASILGRKMGPSTLRTKGLVVTFNFSEGTAEGEVLSGPYSGKTLSTLGKSELKEQLEYFQENDRQSTLLLQAYLMRRGFSSFSGSSSNSNQVADTQMSSEEALQILGLEPNASKEEIIKAHRRLIQKIHPDRGGNEYLAAKINAARDKLVG